MSNDKDRAKEKNPYGTLVVFGYFLKVAFRNSKLYCFIVLFEIILRSVSPFVNIIFPRYLIKELFGERDMSRIIWFIAAITVGNVLFRFLQTVIDTIKGRKTDRLTKILDLMIGGKSMEMDFEHIENPEVLTQAEKAATGMSWYSGGIGALVDKSIVIISSIMTLSGVVVLLSVFSPVIMLMTAVIIAVNMLINAKIASIDMKFRKDLVGINRRFGYYFGLNMDFSYGKDIRLYGAQKLITNRTHKYNREFWRRDTQMNKQTRRLFILSTAVNCVQLVVLHIYVASRVIAGVIDFADYVMLISAAETFAGSINTIINQFIQMKNAAEFMSEYMKFMDYPFIKSMSHRHIKSFDAKNHVIEFRNVSFHYPNREELILDRINIMVRGGEKLSVVGLNGAGKTTFIKLLCRLYDPTEGEILLDGVNIKEYEYGEYLKLFSVVFQDFGMLSFTVRENISLRESETVEKGSGNEKILINKINDSIARAGVSEKINSLEKGIDTSLYKNFDKEGIELSGGEMQKLAIARAIYKDAPVVVLDEPTAALDPVAEYEIYSRFNSLIGAKTAIYISHRMSSCRFCDRIAVFDKGTISEYGTHNELVSAGGRYGEMWNAQAQYYIENGSDA